MQVVPDTHYLGVLLSEDMSFTPHISTTCLKASRTIGFLMRNLRNCPQKRRETAYKTMCRPILEYAAPVWDPFLMGDIKKMEKIQRKGARFVKNDYRRTVSVTEILQTLEWGPLQERRRKAR